MLARTAEKLVSITAVAGTDIIPSVKAINKKNGFRLEPLNFCPYPIFMWFLLYLIASIP
jgi:hypothetical protein